MKKLAPLILLLVLFASCATQKRCAELFPAVIDMKDSVRTEYVTVRDTIFRTPADSTSMFLPFPCPPEFANTIIPVQKSKSGRANLTVSPTAGGYQINCDCSEVEFKAKLYDRYKEIYVKQFSERTLKVSKPASGWTKFVNSLGYIVIVYFVLKLAVQILSLIYPQIGFIKFLRYFF